MKRLLLAAVLAVGVLGFTPAAEAQFFPRHGPTLLPYPVPVFVPAYVPPATYAYSNYATPFGVSGQRTVITPYGAYSLNSSYATPYNPYRSGFNYGIYGRPGGFYYP